MLKLGVNIDHVATVREARKVVYPNPLDAALICEKVGAFGITAHLREDRRHINDNDLKHLCANIKRVNMEMAATKEMIEIAKKFKPYSSCLVPEKREELTTEGGLEVKNNFDWITNCVQKLHKSGIIVSLFIDPDKEQIKAAKESGAEYIELHTGKFCDANENEKFFELERLINGATYANNLGLNVNAGHGIHYENIKEILKIPYLKELNIGHSIISRAVIVGIKQATEEMLGLMK